MKRDEINELKNLRNQAYCLFLDDGRFEGIRPDIKDKRRKCRRAIIFALNGDFRTAYSLINELRPVSLQRFCLYQSIKAFRNSFELVTEREQAKKLDDLDLLLVWDYIDAARLFVHLETKECYFPRWRTSLRIYDKTRQPVDIELARKYAKLQRVWGEGDSTALAFTEIALTTRYIDDLYNAEEIIKKASHIDSITCLLKLYKGLKDTRYLKKAIASAKEIKKNRFWVKIEAWKEIAKASPTKQNKRFLALAIDRQKKFERECRQDWLNNFDQNDPKHCIELAEYLNSLTYIRRAIRLLKNYEGTDFLEILGNVFTAIDRRRNKLEMKEKK